MEATGDFRYSLSFEKAQHMGLTNAEFVRIASRRGKFHVGSGRTSLISDKRLITSLRKLSTGKIDICTFLGHETCNKKHQFVLRRVLSRSKLILTRLQQIDLLDYVDRYLEGPVISGRAEVT
jgi:hypothetical protein